MKEILDRCKCGVYFTANEHRDYYMKAEDWLVEQCQDQSDIDDIGKDIWDEMIKKDTVYTIQFYPDTPVGFYKIFHYDYDLMINKALDILKERLEEVK